MATGIVVGLTRYCDGWDVQNQTPGVAYLHSVSTQISPSTMNPSAHHRSYSDAPGNLGRLRLPPIGNLIEGAGRPDLSHRPSYPGTQLQSRFPTGLRSNHPPPIQDSSVWSPGGDARLPYPQGSPQRYDHRPPSQQYYSSADYRRASVALPQPPSSDSIHNPVQILPQQLLDPLSPQSRTTAKNVVREEVVPGKGMCYVYDDGSVCQKVINGDTVNPKWGTTKAGKPRKRLGQACNTCREKKIKCDPSYPKCTQCQKFGRECRFEAPTRAVNKSPHMCPGSSPTDTTMTEDTIRTRRPSAALTEASSHSESGTISSKAAGTVDDHLSPLTNDSNFLPDAPNPSKRARLAVVDSDVSSIHRTHISSHDARHCFSLEVDPFKVNKKLTEAYLSLYFLHVNNSALSLVPEHSFLRWAEHAEDKSQASKLVLYCMLALGCSFSKSTDRASHARTFSEIALEGVMQSFGHFSIQLIQARIIFALHEFQNGREEGAWDLCGAALRAAVAMNLNTEDGIAHQLRDNISAYGLDQTRLAECMRRTFWVAHTMDNLGVACLCITTTISKASYFLRLPCSRQAYESGVIPDTPMFDGEIQSAKNGKLDEQIHVGSLGYLVQISSLCCDVRTLAFRASHRVSHSNRKQDLITRDELHTQLRSWNESYMTHINRKFSRKSPLKGQYPFSFGGLHLLYHYAGMQLHRNMPHAQLTRSQIAEHAQMAYHHAESTLSIAAQFTIRKSLDICDYHFGMSSPMSGYAIHYAIDIMSAAGINAKLLENQSPVLGLIMDSVQLLDSLVDVWSSARLQQKQVSERIRLVMHSAHAGISENKIGFCMGDPMVATLSREEDLVYGIDRMQYLRSFDWAEQIRNPADLNVVSSRGTRGTYSVWKD